MDTTIRDLPEKVETLTMVQIEVKSFAWKTV